MSETQTALVLGAGIGGLAAARALQQAGFAVEVLERAPALRGGGAAISLWPNALTALDFLGLGEAVRRAGQPQGAGTLRNGRGAVLAALDSEAVEERFGEVPILIERAVLHELLVGAIGEGAITLGFEAIGAEASPAPAVALAGGARRSADLVIAADGAGSSVRAALFDRRPARPSGIVAWRGLAELDERLGAGLLPGELWTRGALFGVARLAGARAYWWAAERGRGGAAGSAAGREALSPDSAGWPEAARALLDRTPTEGVIRTELLERPPLRSFVTGAVALLGDAAHPMLPHLGQGGCLALEDAAVLGACLAACGGDPVPALARYDRERVGRVVDVARRSARMARIAHLRGPLAAARDLAMRAMPRAAALRQLDPVLAWGVPR